MFSLPVVTVAAVVITGCLVVALLVVGNGGMRRKYSFVKVVRTSGQVAALAYRRRTVDPEKEVCSRSL